MADERETARSELLQLLDAGVLDLLDVNVWVKLSDEARGSLRLTCQPTKRMANELLVAASFDMTQIDGGGNVVDADVGMLDAISLETWQRDADARSAFLAALPRLDDLLLHDWTREADLMSWLLRFGDAGGGCKLTTLRLDSGALTLAGGCAIRIACPQLQHLTLGNCVHHGHMEFDWETQLSGEVCLPLRGSPMTSLTMGFGCTLDADVLSSLGGLSNLQSLSLDISITSQQLHLLRGLANLQHCLITPGGHQHFDIVDAAALFSLTKLTHLELLTLAHSAGDGDAGGDEWQAAVALLGGLISLQSLQLGAFFTVDDAIMAALHQLTQLTALAVAGMQLSRRSPGLLPGLKSVSLRGYARPVVLLRSVLALLPLSQLTEFHSWFVDICCADNADAAVQVAALAQAAKLLAAAAPRVLLSGVKLRLVAGAGDGVQHLPFLQVLDAVQPLASCMPMVHISGVDLQQLDWGTVARLLPGTQQLQISSCLLSDAGGLVAIAVKWAALRVLEVHACTGVTDGGWLMLCAARAALLQVRMYQKLSAEVLAECREVQESAYGRQNVVWL